MRVAGSNPIARSNLLLLLFFAAGCASTPDHQPPPKPTFAEEVAFLKEKPGLPPSAPYVEAPTRTHVVVKGETLYSIAKQYGVTVDALMGANGMHDPRALKVGQTLRIP